MSKEKLRFNISLRSTHWDKKPEFVVTLNDTAITQGVCDGTEECSFYHELSEGDHELQIQLVNKEDSDCVQNEDKTEILKDMQLHIDSISIDNINLEHIKHTCSTFVPADSKQHETLSECVDLGWNGTYILKFTSPFYIWLLENM
jgi:hypothetical protein